MCLMAPTINAPMQYASVGALVLYTKVATISTTAYPQYVPDAQLSCMAILLPIA